MKSDAVPVSPEALATRAATVDELLSDEFESLPGLKCDADQAAKRLVPGATRAAAAIGSCSIDG